MQLIDDGWVIDFQSVSFAFWKEGVLKCQNDLRGSIDIFLGPLSEEKKSFCSKLLDTSTIVLKM